MLVLHRVYYEITERHERPCSPSRHGEWHPGQALDGTRPLIPACGLSAPAPAHRLIPSRFPPIGLFDTVATAADLEPVMDLAGWTNDRLVTERINRLPRAEWVYGRPNASIIMASFLHVAPGGMRFNSAGLGAWYAAAALRTAVAEVAHHLRREAVARGVVSVQRQYRQYTSVLEGSYLDIRGQEAARPDVYDPSSFAASQVLGEAVRASGRAGIIYHTAFVMLGASVWWVIAPATSWRSPRPATSRFRRRPRSAGLRSASSQPDRVPIHMPGKGCRSKGC
jgi:RES domain-containing protein